MDAFTNTQIRSQTELFKKKSLPTGWLGLSEGLAGGLASISLTRN
ncbi:hypothetical protein M092_2373 [Parabacteroides distasonis str. 3776 D15 iv]|nr:hypothetical protein M090_0591 [Parabacteroides distasonis str. 3776 Po2 i]KDS70698.1 hypothetical protein M092_2373 [Parabacteroides distasonis str. 3776 D15 iv]